MTRALNIATFLFVALSILGSAHLYVWMRLVRDPDWAPLPATIFTGIVILLYLAVPAAVWVRATVSSSAAKSFLVPAWSWLGFLFILVVLLISVDIGRILLKVLQGWFPFVADVDPGRRLLLARTLGGLATLGTVALGIGALKSGLGHVRVREIRVSLERLPQELDGTTIVQLSDVHVGPTIGREFVERIVKQTNDLRPHLIAITGDLVDGSVETLRHAVAPLKNLRSRYGAFFVTGNHEYYSGAGSWCDELERLGIRVLRNERVEVGDGDASFDLAGIHDYAGHRKGYGPDLEKALEGRDPNRELVLLVHQPKALDEAIRHGVGLQLSGHTHGGQMWPWNYLVRMTQPLVAGLKKFENTWLYVNSGTGYWGPPMRLGAPAEITHVTLVSAQSFDA